MIYHLIEYYRIPHPLLKEKGYIAVSDPEVFSKKCFRVWIDDKKSTGDAELPRITRVLLSPYEIKEAEGERLVKIFEKNAKIQHERSFNILKLKIFLRFTSACAIGYFIYWTVYNLPWVWVPVNLFLEKILGDTLTSIFQGVVIALAPGLSFIKNFVGAKRYGRINFRSRYTKIIPGFDKTSRRYFTHEVKKCLTNIKESAKEEGVEFDITCLEKITEEIINEPAVNVDFARDWLFRFEKILEELSERAEEEDFFEGVVL
ncbi:hypothetical protein H5U35_04095, partial [Candidatus Aerophobetes bacterium]|nr:hypothetical protein [Candidatus Aerophobetes bacterium]